MLGPVLTPAELWETSGRIGIPIVFKLKDRAGRDFVLPFSHEETMTFHARELQSYKQLPQVWYHFSTKERDEPRPRGGLLRVREFIMKDSYSFDRDEAGLDAALRRAQGGVRAHLRSLRPRGALRRGRVRNHGRPRVVGLHGADRVRARTCLIRCENGDYFADYDAARGIPRAPDVPRAARPARGGRDAGRDDDRVAGGAPRHRPRGDLEGHARDGRRATRARTDSRRRPPQRGEARDRPRTRPTERRPTTRSGRRSAPAAARSGLSA